MANSLISVSVNSLINYTEFLSDNASIVSAKVSQNHISALIIKNKQNYRDGCFPLVSNPNGDNQFEIIRHDIHGNWLGITPIVSKTNFHDAIWLSDNELLLVCGRSKSKQENAVVYDAEGNWLRQFYIGDAVEDIKVDSEGNIWVSYFDEGLAKPISEYGLVCFTSKGEMLWHHDQTGNGTMLDCYALNIDDENNIWHYAYPDFCLRKTIPDTSEIGFEVGNDGAHFSHVQGESIFMSGGYSDNKLYLSELSLTKQTKKHPVELKIDSKTSSLNAKHYISSDKGHLAFMCDNVLYLQNMGELIKRCYA